MIRLIALRINSRLTIRVAAIYATARSILIAIGKGSKGEVQRNMGIKMRFD